MSQLVYDMRDNTPNLIICTSRYVDGRIFRILCFQVDFPLVEQEPLDRELLAHPHHDDSIVEGSDRAIHHNDIPIMDGCSYHGITSHPHKESANRMKHAQIIQA